MLKNDFSLLIEAFLTLILEHKQKEMGKYNYKKVKGFKDKKFIENGHTMFEEDVLQRLKRLEYLEDLVLNSSNNLEELIEKYKRWIKKAEKEINLNPAPKVMHLIGKVSILKMVIIDLQE